MNGHRRDGREGRTHRGPGGASLAPAAFVVGGLALAAVAVAVAVPAHAAAQIPDALTSTPVPAGEGWEGFQDTSFLLDTFVKLLLAAVLATVISYHPLRMRAADTLEEIEAPKATIAYAVVGSLVGLIVVRTDLLVGFVIFGIGALFRFRTVMRSPQLTGQVILATLIGLACGLDLPYIAVVATVFDAGLTFLLEARMTYLLDVRGLPEDRFSEAVAAYRGALVAHDVRVRSEKKNPQAGRVRFVFRSARSRTRGAIEDLLEQRVDPALKGNLDWQID
ncbi:MAG: hypothetical protein KJO11_03690 [Gemmatimonadetes bacterium]|nr:hypothetical protein [Gemmatimonadota bacterium]NNK62842.1 hypothetical protein [Gemmatimonadota bacterium]